MKCISSTEPSGFLESKINSIYSKPFSPKIAKSLPKCITVEHDRRYSHVSEAAELQKEGTVCVSESSVRKLFTQVTQHLSSYKSVERQGKYLKSSKACVNVRLWGKELLDWVSRHGFPTTVSLILDPFTLNSTSQLIPAYCLHKPSRDEKTKKEKSVS